MACNNVVGVDAITINQRDQVKNTILEYKYDGARTVLLSLIEQNKDDWSLYYLIGHCSSMICDFDGAIKYLRLSVELNCGEQLPWLALGTAYQKKGLYKEAVLAFLKAIEIDSTYSYTYCSLAYTQFTCLGDLEHALHNYQQALYSHCNNIVGSMHNHISNHTSKLINMESELWIDFALRAVMYRSVLDDVNSFYIEQNEVEVKQKKYGGLYWFDRGEDNTRIILPNYFNAFKSKLLHEEEYYIIAYNIGEVLQAIGRIEEAELHFHESQVFAPSWKPWRKR